MLKFLRTLSACLFVAQIVSCGPTANKNHLNAETHTASAKSSSDDLNEEEQAPLGLTGLADRVCRLNYSFVKKSADGNYSVVGDGSTSDGVPRGGYGRGCINFCLVTFDELTKNNAPNGVEILVKGCQFVTGAAPASAQAAPSSSAIPAKAESKNAAAAAQAAAAPSPAATEFQSKKEACKVVQVDQVVIFAEQRTRSECASECDSRAQTNPQRRCEWGTEVLRQHPTNQCILRGGAGKLLYQQTVTRFQCRMECKARETTNPNRSCLWGGENVKAP
ncbi:MAG: hypothetical protein RIR26_911 [Pseudomonadota bacterium]|jgi:hypothetical protein